MLVAFIAWRTEAEMKPAVLLVLGAAIAFVDGYPALCKEKYLYKQDNAAECSICGICPPNAGMEELERMGLVRPECKNKSGRLPEGQLGQYAWCWQRDSKFPEKEEISVNEPDNKDSRGQPALLIVLGILAFISVVVSGLVVFVCRRRRVCTKKTKTRISDTPRECTVQIDVQPFISTTSSGIVVPPGTPLRVEARCSCRGQRHQVRHVMVVNLGAPPKLFGKFLSKGSSSPKVLLPSFFADAEFAWIAQVLDRSSRSKEERQGTFRIKVDDTPREAASVELGGDDKQHLLYDNAAAQNILGSEDMNNFNPTQCEDVEGMLAMKRLLEDKTMMEQICRCLDRERSQGVCSWHHLATRLLGFQPQALDFIEYHLKGKLYEGPTSHVMRLLYQQGVPVGAFLQCLQQCSSSHGLVSRITAFLKASPAPQPSGSLAFPELVQGFDRR